MMGGRCDGGALVDTTFTNQMFGSCRDCICRVERIDDLLTVAVTDNGRGGASLAKGHGLAGLAERVNGVDGDLTIESPPGGPTVVQAFIPCAS